MASSNPRRTSLRDWAVSRAVAAPDPSRARRRTATMGLRNRPTSETMNQHAEYVSPGHPDRLADAIAESIVTAAVLQKLMLWLVSR